MDRIKGIISGGIYNKAGQKVQDIFLYNYDTIDGRLSDDFSTECYRVDEFKVLVENPSLISRVYEGTYVKVPMYPTEAMFIPETFTIKGSAENSKFVISYDQGTQWWYWDGASLVPTTFADANELKAIGMDINALNAITADAHDEKYVDHVVLAMTPSGEDFIEGYDMTMVYTPTRSSSAATRWIGDVKNIDRYTFNRTPISTGQLVDGNTTYYDINISNIGGTENLIIKNICAENFDNSKIATFANVDLSVEPDHVLIGKYRLIRNAANDVLEQIDENTKMMLLGTTNPDYTDGAFSVNLSNYSGATLLGESGFNAPTNHASVYPVLADSTLREQQLNRTVVIPETEQHQHNEINAGWLVSSNGNLNVTSTDPEFLSKLSHFPAYLRMRMLTTGTESTTEYLPYIQHRPDSLFSNRLAYLSADSNTLFHMDFLRNVVNPLPWNYIEYHNVGIESSDVPMQSVNPFHDVILDTFEDKIVIRRYSGDQLFEMMAQAGETFQMAWVNRDDPSGRCLYIIANDSVTGDNILFSSPISFVLDSSDESITVVTNGDLSERFFYGNVSDPDSEYAMVAKDVLELHQALAGTAKPSDILGDMQTETNLYSAYSSNTIPGTVNTGSTLHDQKWGQLEVTLAGDSQSTTNGPNYVVDFAGSGYAFTDEVVDDLSRRTALRPDSFVSFKLNPVADQDAIPLQMDDVWLNIDAAAGLKIGTNAVWPNFMNIESSYGWFIGGNEPNDIVRMDFGDDTIDLIARASMAYDRAYHGICFRSMGVWMAGGTTSAGTLEKYDLTSDTSNSLERGSLATPMTKGDGHSGDAQYGRMFNRFGNTPVQAIDYDNDSVATTPRVDLPQASNEDLVDSSMLLHNEESTWWGYPVNNWVSGGAGVFHGSVNILEIQHANDTAIANDTLITNDTTGGISGLFGHIYNNGDYGWFSQYNTLDFAECGSGIDFKRLDKNLSLITVETRMTGVGAITSCSGADSYSNRKTSMNNNDYGYSIRNQNEASQRKDLNNDTLSFVTRATPPTDKRNAAACSDWLVSNAKPFSENIRLGTYISGSNTEIGLWNTRGMTVGIQGDTVQVAPRKDEDMTKGLSWLGLGARISPNTGYDNIGEYNVSDYFEGQLSDIHVGAGVDLDGAFRHLPYMYDLADVEGFESTHTLPSTFTFIIEGHSEKITHYFIDTANGDAITEINTGNMGNVTPVDIDELNAALVTLKAFFNTRARIGLVTYDLETTNSYKVSKTYVKTRHVVRPIHPRAYGMDSSGNYSETDPALNARFTTRLFAYNGRGIWIPKDTSQEKSVVEDIVNRRRLTEISPLHTFDNIQVCENGAGFICFIDRSTINTSERHFLWVGKNDYRYVTELEDYVGGYEHVSMGTYNVWDESWSVQTCLTDPSLTEWNDKSREYFANTGDRVLCIPTRNDIASGSIGSSVERTSFLPWTITTDSKLDVTRAFPEVSVDKYKLISATAPFIWESISWSFANGASSPHFSMGDIFSTALLGYHGAAIDNWQILNSFNLMMHCKADIQDYSTLDAVTVDVSDEMKGRVGEIDEGSSLITEPATLSKFFLY